MTSRFDWVRRMGMHEAYHQSAANWLMHWVCIPLELFAFLKLVSLVQIGPIDLALIVVVVVGAIYVAAEPLGGLLMSALLGGLWFSASRATSGSTWIDALAAVGLFVAAFTAQTQIGHRVFEHGVDDTQKNVAELARTKNPVPILLVFFY